MSKWDFGIKLKEVIDQNFKEYIITKTYEYTTEKLNDYDLWIAFKENFKDFTLSHFEKIPLKDYKGLYKTLRCNSVRVKYNNKNITISQLLFNVL